TFSDTPYLTVAPQDPDFYDVTCLGDSGGPVLRDGTIYGVLSAGDENRVTCVRSLAQNEVVGNVGCGSDPATSAAAGFLQTTPNGYFPGCWDGAGTGLVWTDREVALGNPQAPQYAMAAALCAGLQPANTWRLPTPAEVQALAARINTAALKTSMYR